ncbi:yippee-domain-containing protein [Parathielavia hyrcaniae]|uniref:Yippee-domain-containing protein n=1 Tax=Parathielavia hyrcaniae TaxID=113614 RepID=A0AAN6Q6C4_9PEZI|nr:yippee-domain-containing protein [Parathielavia hyrcaniae]
MLQLHSVLLDTQALKVHTVVGMFGEVLSLRRPSAKAEPSSTPQPSFPVYLLPSLRIPFRRRGIYELPPPSGSGEPSSPGSTAPSLSTSPTSPISPSTPPRRLSRAQPPTLRCTSCSTDLALLSQIVSKGFTGRHGRAYLVSPPPPPLPDSSASLSSTGAKRHTDSTNTDINGGAHKDLVNIRVGRSETRRLVTGAHVVADIYCLGCGAVLGWKYLDTAEPAQRYKVGMFILETRRVVGFRCWEDVDVEGLDMDNMGLDGHYEVGAPGRGSWGYDGNKKARDEGDDEEDGVVVFDSEDEDECEDMFAGVWDAQVVARRRKSRTG